MKSLLAFKGKTSEERDAYRASIRVDHPNAFTPWSSEDEQKLMNMFNDGYEVEDLAVQLQRNVGGISARIKNWVCWINW